MRMEELPPFYLKTHSDVDAQILNQLVLIIIFVRVESIHKVSIIVDGNQYADVGCNMHLDTYPRRDKQVEVRLFTGYGKLLFCIHILFSKHSESPHT